MLPERTDAICLTVFMSRNITALTITEPYIMFYEDGKALGSQTGFLLPRGI